ncbi:Uncharacterized protein BP5553_03540 [Venustampulla echinocandica]|uniref:M protein repeat protein n=1 Tax=Venustampulla echinocandica TaxID=2656787 RepID=A0A370TUM6_9HELO|nr:Uncharacterized protein BP5553_03540 [Venustampulla echinocandica]RDL39200.1 Uncharacterized protein BP5553_03540 [Venustampulla echinocandica]
MADAEEKAKAEKIAAAKKRVEQMKKKQKKAGAKKEDKDKPASPAAESSKAEDTATSPSAEAAALDATESTGDESKAATTEGDKAKDKGAEETISELNPAKSHQRQPSLSLQSKMRSSSFRQGSVSGAPLSPNFGFSPDGDTAPDIYRKQAIRIEELEKENKRLAKDAVDGEKRWKKAEEELDELREAEDDSKSKEKGASPAEGSSKELEKLRTENTALQRQNTQLQAQSSRATRHGSSPSVSVNAPADYEAALASKSSTIESMEIEISNLRARLDKVNSGASVKEQIAALEEKLLRSERAAVVAQRELGDLKKNLDRTTEKAVKEGSERISAETKLRTLEREGVETKSHSDELQKKVEALEKKVATLATLHKEHDARFQAQKKEREKAEKDASDLRTRLGGLENENLRLRDERERARKRDAEGIDDDGVDELENEERQRLEKKVRELEAEVHELRRGVWRERRKELEGESPGTKFTDVDLGGSIPPGRRSVAHGGKGLGDLITSGINVITGATAAGDEGLLEDDEDMDFDEDAFKQAHEEEAKKQLERVKEIKRGLKNWEGWRLDLVENRRGGGEGIGEIFEI